mgnify:CR=1 FL=1
MGGKTERQEEGRRKGGAAEGKGREGKGDERERGGEEVERGEGAGDEDEVVEQQEAGGEGTCEEAGEQAAFAECLASAVDTVLHWQRAFGEERFEQRVIAFGDDFDEGFMGEGGDVGQAGGDVLFPALAVAVAVEFRLDPELLFDPARGILEAVHNLCLAVLENRNGFRRGLRGRRICSECKQCHNAQHPEALGVNVIE